MYPGSSAISSQTRSAMVSESRLSTRIRLISRLDGHRVVDGFRLLHVVVSTVGDERERDEHQDDRPFRDLDPRPSHRQLHLAEHLDAPARASVVERGHSFTHLSSV
jgi:hypothetical protein